MNDYKQYQDTIICQGCRYHVPGDCLLRAEIYEEFGVWPMAEFPQGNCYRPASEYVEIPYEPVRYYPYGR